MPDDAELRAAWTDHVGDGPGALDELDEVLGRHRGANRRYHGVRHVTWVVRHVLDLARTEPVDDLGAVVAAAFFHDAVYDATAGDNEEQSARMARRVLVGLGWDEARAEGVAELVRATAAHEATDERDRAVLLDADLAVLGSEPAAYQAYVTGVRAEYGHVPDDDWRRGRSAVLQRFLTAPQLYSTVTGRTRWEARARANVTAELAGLRSHEPHR
jgi:predicted metal-dependent HD superfamily phosphohydrolase